MKILAFAALVPAFLIASPSWSVRAVLTKDLRFDTKVTSTYGSKGLESSNFMVYDSDRNAHYWVCGISAVLPTNQETVAAVALPAGTVIQIGEAAYGKFPVSAHVPGNSTSVLLGETKGLRLAAYCVEKLTQDEMEKKLEAFGIAVQR